FYDDSPTAWRRLMEPACKLIFQLSKPLAHAYLFCDVEMFEQLKIYMTMAGWNCFRTPLIYINPSGMRAPWPTSGPQRKWQMILYAKKGERLVKYLAPDVITCSPDSNLGHPAQKPIELYRNLLRRSVNPGDSVLDPFCGSGTIFPACHELLLKATGVEQDPVAYGIAAKRLGELK
ncbi:MAG: DNA methyltransferase, partial [Candidatus Dormibacteria bacterium]